MATQKRCGIESGHAATAEGDGAARPSLLPEHWRTNFLEKVRSVTQEEEEALAEPVGQGLKHRAKAKTFLMEVALVDYVSSKNQRGLGVSTRAILERRGFLLDPEVVHSHTRLKALARKEKKWVHRWQRRHGLTRGRFRTGCGLTPEQQRTKVVRAGNRHVVLRIIKLGLSWSGRPEGFFSRFSELARPVFWSRQTATISRPQVRVQLSDGVHFRVEKLDRKCRFGNQAFRCRLRSRWAAFRCLAPLPWRRFGSLRRLASSRLQL